MSARLRVKFLLVAFLGLATVAVPARASAPMFESCGWCANMCPGDLIGFCNDHCGVSGGSCTSGGCRGVDGHVYDYDVECGII
jgi:hypothetical protein